MENRELSVSNKQNADVFAKHITKVYNNKGDRVADAAKFIWQREISSELDAHITLREFDRTIRNLRNNGARGIQKFHFRGI